MAVQEPDRDPNSTVMIFIGISGILVLFAIILIIVLLVAGSAIQTATSSGIPYNIDKRPLPTVDRANDLLFENLGSFKRGPVKGAIHKFTATYISGEHKIIISGSQAVSLRSAQASVSRIANDENRSGATRLLDGDPSYYFFDTNGVTRLSWSHDRWFFDVQASSKVALDEFMKVFRY
jgi:hypothetical protein